MTLQEARGVWLYNSTLAVKLLCRMLLSVRAALTSLAAKQAVLQLLTSTFRGRLKNPRGDISIVAWGTF